MRPNTDRFVGGPAGRRGASLTEVLVALAVVSIGLTSVIALFPVGIDRLQRATNDTRCTTLAESGWDLFRLHRMHNDQTLVNFNGFDQQAATGGDAAAQLDGEGNNRYAWSLTPGAEDSDRYVMALGDQVPAVDSMGNATIINGITGSDAFVNLSYPILLDPIAAVEGGVGAIPIFQYYQGEGVAVDEVPYASVRVATLSAATAGPSGNLVRRLFASTESIEFVEGGTAQPVDPSDGTGSFGVLTGQPTATRDYEYSWAVMLQRELEPDTGGTGLPVARPATADRGFQGRAHLLCFHRRDPTDSFRLIEGCFYNGSKTATLSWPSDASFGGVEDGQWICELSISRHDGASGPTSAAGEARRPATNRHTGLYPGLTVTWHYRRGYEFYRVVEALEPEIASGGARLSQRVTIETIDGAAPSGYPLRHVGVGVDLVGDTRPPDLYGSPRWPIATNNPVGRNVGGANAPQFYPVVIFNNLLQVYDFSN